MWEPGVYRRAAPPEEFLGGESALGGSRAKVEMEPAGSELNRSTRGASIFHQCHHQPMEDGILSCWDGSVLFAKTATLAFVGCPRSGNDESLAAWLLAAILSATRRRAVVAMKRPRDLPV